MRKRFGYPFYNSVKFIVKHNGKNAILVELKRINLLLVNQENQVIMELMKMVNC